MIERPDIETPKHPISAEFETPRHPIGVVAERTRLSQDVLRVWERRYNVVEPGRSPSGQRLYSDADIERLRLLARATATGRSISQVAALPTPDLARMVREDEAARGAATPRDRTSDIAGELLDPALERTLVLDGAGLHALLWRAILALGLPGFLDGVAAPLLIRIGEEWHAGRLTPAHEHMASAVVQRVIAAAMQTMVVAPNAPALLLATPAGERHEIGALLAAAAASAEGWRVIYLGADLPSSDIADAAIRSGANAVGLSIVFAPDTTRVIEEINALRGALPVSIPLLIGGGGSARVTAGLERDGVRFLRTLGELRQELSAET